MNYRAVSALAAMLLGSHAATAETGMVWKTPTCGCCKAWVAYMKAKGFDLSVTEATPRELANVQSKAGIAKPYAGCHSAHIAGYQIEGHVPATDIARLLAEKPDAIGLSVPGMPQGSPGMETDGTVDAYDVLLLKKDGTTSVFSSYPAAAK